MVFEWLADFSMLSEIHVVNHDAILAFRIERTAAHDPLF